MNDKHNNYSMDELLKKLAFLDSLVYTLEHTTPIKDFIECMVKRYRENLSKTIEDYKKDYDYKDYENGDVEKNTLDKLLDILAKQQSIKNLIDGMKKLLAPTPLPKETEE